VHHVGHLPRIHGVSYVRLIYVNWHAEYVAAVNKKRQVYTSEKINVCRRRDVGRFHLFIDHKGREGE